MQAVLFAAAAAALASLVALILYVRRNGREMLQEFFFLRRQLAAREDSIRCLKEWQPLSQDTARQIIRSGDAVGSLHTGVAPYSPAGDLTVKAIAARLEFLKSFLPENDFIGANYVAEFHNLLDLLQKRTDLDLSSYRLPPQYGRTVLRIYILALLGLCSAQQFHPIFREVSPLSAPSAPSARRN